MIKRGESCLKIFKTGKMKGIKIIINKIMIIKKIRKLLKLMRFIQWK